MKQHTYTVRVEWTDPAGEGTKTYKSYQRDHSITSIGKPEIPASSDPSFRGNSARYNPEELLVASLSSCHMLWYLHLACNAGIVVKGYEDTPLGVGETGSRGEGRFVRAVLRPRIIITRGADLITADRLHHEVHQFCFIARSVNFPVSYEASYVED